METQLPAGTVTFLFTDIEGSTELIRRLGDGYGQVLDDHRRLLREHLGNSGGREIDTQGDAFFFSFTRARDAVAGAVAAQRALQEHEWRDDSQVKVRMGLHTGEPAVGTEGYHGLDVVRAARICSAGHGGQILISETTRVLVGSQLPDGVQIVDLGTQRLKDVDSERIFQLSLEGEPDQFPVLKGRDPAWKSHADTLGEEFSHRIGRFVEEQIDRSIARAKQPPPQPVQPKSNAAQILAVVILGVIALLVVIRYVFF